MSPANIDTLHNHLVNRHESDKIIRERVHELEQTKNSLKSKLESLEKEKSSSDYKIRELMDETRRIHAEMKVAQQKLDTGKYDDCDIFNDNYNSLFFFKSM